ncbi:hypothetical protein [Leekyejoonella antrihumi]|uniref:Uncharacterized protein n=1 Tax=Leekyejoonella antrihumi TaxID=1660198 RepID=A0A563DS46_9MICO|nr:hypothetical protein [Leekyejoonella antrihumi]TWP33055.1 hypothetical protein FGL98_22475 [Leekyejoonella antrihumi]
MSTQPTPAESDRTDLPEWIGADAAETFRAGVAEGRKASMRRPMTHEAADAMARLLAGKKEAGLGDDGQPLGG